MKKLISLLLTLLLLLSLTSCGEVSLYDRGLEVVSLLDQAVGSDAYLSALSANDALTDILHSAGSGDYTAPKAVYTLRFSDAALADFAELVTPEELPESLDEVLNHRLYSAVMTQINAMAGVESLAASSLCTISKTFVAGSLDSDIIYLYTFETGCPISVTFITGEDDTVTASGTFLFYENFPTDSAEAIAAFFGDGSVDVAQVSK